MLKKVYLLIILLIQCNNAHSGINRNCWGLFKPNSKVRFQYFVNQIIMDHIEEINSEIFTIKHQGRDFRGTALMKAAFFGYNDIIKQILNINTVDINQKHSIDGNTALNFAIMNNQKGAVALLLDYDIDLYIANNNNQTSFDIAKDQNNPKIVNLLTSCKNK